MGLGRGWHAAALLASALSGEDFYAWGWRIPFVAGFLLGPIGYYLRRKVAETPAFAQAVERKKVERSPLRVAIGQYGTRMLQAFGLSIIGCIANFVFVVYLVSYAINTVKLPPGSALSCAVAFGLVVMTLTPFVGMLSDRIGRRPLILACALLNLVFDYPLSVLASAGGTVQPLLRALV